MTDNRVLNDLDVQSYNALFGQALNTHRAAIGLPPVDNVRAHILTDHPWLAADTALARITPCVKPCPAANSAGPDGAAGLGPLGAPRTPGANAPNRVQRIPVSAHQQICRAISARKTER